MKKVTIIAISFLAVFASCDQKTATENTTEERTEVTTDMVNNPATAAEEPTMNEEDAPKFEFEELVQNFGEISQGEKVKKLFRFTNIGNSDLIISDAKGSCGCTVPLWPRNPIAPGQEGEIEVVFDSNGKSGHQKKTVTLVANTVPNTMVIAIEGDILVPTNEAK